MSHLTRHRLFGITLGRNAVNAAAQWLRTVDNIPNNISPFILPVPSYLYAMSISVNVAPGGNVNIMTHIDAAVRAGGTPASGMIGSLTILGGALQAYVVAPHADLSADLLPAGTEVGVYLHDILNTPLVTVWFAEA